MDGFKKIKESFVEANMQHVQIGMKNIFRDTQLQKVTDVTLMKQLTEEEQRKLEEQAAEESQRPSSTEKVKQSNKAASVNQSVSQASNHPNANKFVPSCISLRTGPLPTMSDLFDFWKYSASLPIENRFSYIIDDRTFEEVNSEMECPIIDLGMGLGCEYIHVKGVGKPERVAKVIYYSRYFQDMA